MDEREVRKERSHFRDPDLGPWHRKHGFDYSVADPSDLDLNDRHREWGWNCPAVDIDQLFLEYDNFLPVALVDYKLRKHLNGQEPYRNAANYLALSNFCKEVPFYAVFYTKNPWSFRPIWINTQAKQLAPRKQFLTETEYVRWIYWLRDHPERFSLSQMHKLDNQITWESPSPFHAPNHHRSHKKRQNKPVPTLFDPTPVQQQKFSEWEIPV